MPANFPEVWLDRVITNLDNSDQATFLQGIPELAVDVSQINEGMPSEKNKIYVPTTEFEVDVLINNNTYPIPIQQYNDDTIEMTLDKYQTKQTPISDDQTIGASYAIIDVVTKSHVRSMLVDKIKRAIHSIAPLKDTVATPIIEVTGGSAGLTDANGRKRLTYEDLVEAKKRCKGFDTPRIVLSPEHYADLALDRKNFGNQLVNYSKGQPNPMIAGFEIHTYNGDMPVYDASNTKKPYGAVASSSDKIASVIFEKEAIAKKTGLTKQYFKPAKEDTATQSNWLNYRHYFIVMPFQNKKIAAIL
ncbi:phage major capsid protein [Tenacibaculum piscium]|uniref:phage major capsid protein n=1 Tax=Tenacibaculum piscium TaxID=1458515 RepID=UPI001F1637FC|nr:hypothetical protein [Tenacibaculum piscium]